MTSLVSRNILRNVFRQNTRGYQDLFWISDNRDYRSCNNREITIIALVKK
jgi:hypothetical protein